jgi:peptide/nickel transport system permease protein
VDATVESAVELEPTVPRRGPWLQALSRFRRRPLGMSALVVVLLFCLVGALAGVLAPYQAGQEFLQFIQKPQPPLTAHHLLGTDVLSHDFLTQILFSIHQTILSGLVCAALAAAIGTFVGALAGYFGGWFDTLVTWASGVVVAVPAIVVMILVNVWVFPLTPLRLGFWLTAVLWTGPARVVRAAIAQQRPREYVEAARAAGASSRRIIVRHLIPNAIGTIIVAATSIIGQSIVIIATVDYIGYGFNQYEKPTLGGLVADAAHSPSLILTRSVGIWSIWWLYVLPVVLLVVLLVSIALLGDALDDALSPTTQ